MHLSLAIPEWQQGGGGGGGVGGQGEERYVDVNKTIAHCKSFSLGGGNYRMQGHFGQPVLHVSKSFQE